MIANVLVGFELPIACERRAYAAAALQAQCGRETHIATAISVLAVEHHHKMLRVFSTEELVNAL